MKRIICLLLLFCPAVVAADPYVYITRQVATRICGMIYNASTGVWIGAAPTALDCEIDPYTDGASPDGFADAATAEVTIGTTGAFCIPLTGGVGGETDNDYIMLKCHATNANAADYSVILTTLPPGAYDGKTLAEGTNTLDLEANEISADNQFQYNEILLFSTAGKFYASACITSTTNANERVTYAGSDLSSLHTVGDFYILKANASCLGNTYTDTEVAAIKAKTDNLPADPASASSIGGRKGQR